MRAEWLEGDTMRTLLCLTPLALVVLHPPRKRAPSRVMAIVAALLLGSLMAGSAAATTPTTRTAEVGICEGLVQFCMYDETGGDPDCNSESLGGEATRQELRIGGTPVEAGEVTLYPATVSASLYHWDSCGRDGSIYYRNHSGMEVDAWATTNGGVSTPLGYQGVPTRYAYAVVAWSNSSEHSATPDQQYHSHHNRTSVWTAYGVGDSAGSLFHQSGDRAEYYEWSNESGVQYRECYLLIICPFRPPPPPDREAGHLLTCWEEKADDEWTDRDAWECYLAQERAAYEAWANRTLESETQWYTEYNYRTCPARLTCIEREDIEALLP
jgi:hypothetical protein